MRCYICDKLLDPREIRFNVVDEIQPCFDCSNKSRIYPNTLEEMLIEFQDDLDSDAKKLSNGKTSSS